jgi:hypothetical protein
MQFVFFRADIVQELIPVGLDGLRRPPVQRHSAAGPFPKSMK